MTAEEPAAATCDRCGRVEDDAVVLLTWSVAVEHGRRQSCCGACSREHLRAMEARLAPEHW